MKRFAVTIEVGPIDPAVVERLKAAGHAVYRGSRNWLVEAVAPVLGRESIRAQAHVLASGVIAEFALTPTADPPSLSLSDPDFGMDDRPELVLGDQVPSYDPQPLKNTRHKWFNHDWERRGDGSAF